MRHLILLFILPAALLLGSRFNQKTQLQPSSVEHPPALTSPFPVTLPFNSYSNSPQYLTKMKCACGQRFTTESHFTRHQYICKTHVDAARRAFEEGQARHRDKRRRIEEQENSQPEVPLLQSTRRDASGRRAFFFGRTGCKSKSSSSASHSLTLPNPVLIRS